MNTSPEKQRRTAIFLGWSGVKQSEEILQFLSNHFKMVFAGHFTFGDLVDQEKLAALKADFLFCFGPTIARLPLLSSVKSAINFHTAPPRWPGRGGISWALYHGDKTFGVTAHFMNSEIDAGPILRVARFPILAEDTVETIQERVLSLVPKLVQSIVQDIQRGDLTPIAETWERKALKQKELLALMAIRENDSENEVIRKTRAFSHSEKPGPYIEKCGVRFWFLKSKA